MKKSAQKIRVDQLLFQRGLVASRQRAQALLLPGKVVMDVSFISATLVLPPVVAAAFPAGAQERAGRELVILVKPQFEAGREKVGKGGIVRDPEVQRQAVERVRGAVIAAGVAVTDVI